MSERTLLAVDGGGSKTDLALLRPNGELLALARGPQSSPHQLGVDGALEVIENLLLEAQAEAGLPSNGEAAELALLLLAGVDVPEEEEALRAAVARRGWAERISVGNDTFAVLRAGTERGWGVAVVCGSGINCVGVAPDGRHARFPALGPISGDWGGGLDVGSAALFAAARSEDGRGPKTSLERAVPEHFGLETPLELARAIHRGRIAGRRLTELPPLVFSEAERDAVAAEIVGRLASEVVAMARVALERLELADEPVEVLLGGGLLQSGDGRLTAEIERSLKDLGARITVQPATSPPIVGAALLALDEVKAGPEAQERLRRELGGAVDGLRGRERGEQRTASDG